MAPTTLDADADTTTDEFSSEYDCWGPMAYYAPRFLDTISAGLDRLRRLEPNWDMEGAPAIDPAIIDAARRLIWKLPSDVSSIPQVVPSSTGNLQLDWNEGPRSLELEIEDPQTIHYLKWDSEEDIEEEDTFDINDISRVVFLIRWFMRGVTHV